MNTRSLPRAYESIINHEHVSQQRWRSWMKRAALLASVSLRTNGGPLLRRSIDVILVGVGLLLLSPILLLAAIAIKLNSRGPIFYAQERIGRGGRPFKMFKLRTMIVNAEALKSKLELEQPGAIDGVRFKLKRDPRITAVGRILRRFSIDELPQLWNVIRGDMTLIGPRPPVWREVALYHSLALRRLEVVPGITCLWQVGGRSDLSFEQQVELDVQYIDRVRPSEEFKILLRTIPAVLSGKGAY